MKTIRLLNSIKRIAAEEAKKNEYFVCVSLALHFTAKNAILPVNGNAVHPVSGEGSHDKLVSAVVLRYFREPNIVLKAIESIEDEIIHAPEDMRQAHLDAVGAELVKAACNYKINAEASLNSCSVIYDQRSQDSNIPIDIFNSAARKFAEWEFCSLITQKAVSTLFDSLDNHWGVRMDPVKLKEAQHSCPDTSSLKDNLDRHRGSTTDESNTLGRVELGVGASNYSQRIIPKEYFTTDLNENQLLKLLELLKTTVPEKGMQPKNVKKRVFVSADTTDEDWLNLFRPHGRGIKKVKWTMLTQKGNVGKRPLRDLLSLVCTDRKQINIGMLNSLFQTIDKDGEIGKAFTAQDMTEESCSTFHDTFVNMIDLAKQV